MREWRPPAKRWLDIVLSSGALTLLWPVLGIVGLAVRMEDGGPALFKQTRVGRGGCPFKIVKFRTMRAASAGRSITVGSDARITRVGRVLRKYKVDELPQLWNVLVGEMTFVGPRPEVPKYVAMYDRAQAKVLEYTPGITDPASMAFRDESELLASFDDPEQGYVKVVMPRKIEMNLAYAAQATLWSDLKVIADTLRCLV